MRFLRSPRPHAPLAAASLSILPPPPLLLLLLLLLLHATHCDAFANDDGSGRPANGRLLYAWGRDNSNQLSQGDFNQDISSLIDRSKCTPAVVQTAIRTDPTESKLGYVRLSKVFAGREHGFAFADGSDSIYSWGRCESGQCGRAVDVNTGDNPSFGRCTLKQTRLLALYPGHDHTLLTYGEQPGVSIKYDTFIGEGSTGAFQFNGDCRPELLTPKACSRCLPWSQTPAAGKLSTAGPLVDGACQIVTPDTYIVPGSTFTREQGEGGLPQPWCYITPTTDPSCPSKTEVFSGVPWQWVQCNDAGNILLTGDPPQRLQKGSVWFKSYPLPVYQAFETSFAFRIGTNDAVLGGGDGLAFVIQNSSAGVVALGGPGSDLGISKSTRFRGDAGVENSVVIKVDTFDDVGFQVRSCIGKGVTAVNDATSKCSRGSATFDAGKIKDGIKHTVMVSYAPYQLELSFDGVKRMSVPFNMEELVYTNAGVGTAFVGFTSSTGDAYSTHKLVAWSFTSLSQSGSIRAVGANENGQLGLGDEQLRYQANLIKSFPDAASPIVHGAAGSKHSLVITAQSEVFAWGASQFGQLGQSDFLSRNAPTKVRRVSLAISNLGGCPTITERGGVQNWCCPVLVSASSYSSLVVLLIKKQGVMKMSLYGWGDNSVGQIGWLIDNDGIQRNPLSDPAWRSSNSPYLLREFETPRYKFGLIVQLVSGAFHNVALTDADEVLTWGWNLRGQLGFAPPSTLLMSPIPLNIRKNIKSSARVVKIAAGGYHNLVLLSDGTVWVWGSNYYGQLGLGIESQGHPGDDGPKPFRPSSPRNTVYLPTLVPKFSQQNRFVIDIAAGLHHSYAIAECFGSGFPNNIPTNVTATKIGGVWVSNYSALVPMKNFSCDCIFGHKGADCAQQCLMVEKNDVCSANPPLRADTCKLKAKVPCSARGTYDSQERRFDEKRDATYDCNRDATCTCRIGSTGSDCSIDCKPTDKNMFKPGIGSLFNCECQDGFEGVKCDKSTAEDRVIISGAGNIWPVLWSALAALFVAVM
jgi:alpha-tubulin suppressor-like RCC1 family protein